MAAPAISSPASASPVSGTTPVQVQTGAGPAPERVRLLARARGGSGGTEVGASTAAPFVIAWFTPGVPNLAEIELVAVAERGGARAESAPTWVRTQNAGVPTLELVTATTVPPDPALQSLGLAARRPPAVAVPS